MTEDQLQLRDRILTLSADQGFRAELNQVRAKSLLQEVAEQVPPYDWTYIVSRFVRNLTAISWGLETLIVWQREPIKGLESEARQLAYAWESLAKLDEGVPHRVALLNAALAYELAGYQASATCLARRLYPPPTSDYEPNVVDLVSLFIDRRFLRLLQLLAKVSESRSYRDQTLMVGHKSGMDFVLRGLQRCIQSLMRGDLKDCDTGMRLLAQSEVFFETAGLTNEAMAVRGVRSILPQILQRSTWVWLGSQLGSSPRWERYLKLLARGTGPNAVQNRSITELWQSQQTAIGQGFLKDGQSWTIRMPTSAGKTRIAEMALVKSLIEKPGSKCIYVAPYRALVWEIEDALVRIFTDLGYRVSSVVGSYETDDFEDFIFRNTDILITTPEKLDLVHRSQSEFLDNVRLVVLDEGQIVDDGRRGVKFELLLTRLKKRLKEARFLFISAVVPQQTLEDFANWLGGDQGRIVTSEWRPSIQRKAKFQWRGNTGVVRYSTEEDIKDLSEFVPGVIRKRQYVYTNPETLRQNTVVFPGSTRADSAAELAVQFSELGAVLVFTSQPAYAEAVANAMNRALSLRRMTQEPVPRCFISSTETRSLIAAQEWLGAEHPVTRALRNGIAVHHGDLPEVLRKAVEVDFRANRYQVIVATNTLAQGVNLPIRTVVVHYCRRYDPIAQRTAPIPARDYWNIAGRAGRAGIETDGTIVHMVFNRRDEEDFNYYMNKENIEPVRGALFEMLGDLLTGRMSKEAVGAELNSEILAMLVEEGLASPERERFEEILGQSLIHIQTVREGIEVKPLTDIIVEVAKDTLDTVPDAQLRRAYATTGLSTNSCEAIRETITSRGDKAYELLCQAGTSELPGLADLFLECCLSLSEMQPDHEYGGDYTELLLSWITGDDPETLSAKFGEQAGSSQELARFIEEFFGYRLPWGISACIRVASSLMNLEVNELSEFTRYFPSMTKYGLADPKACWLMSFGIASRKVVMDMAAVFQAETEDRDYNSFLQWLSDLDEERLRYEFGLSGVILEDVSRAILRYKSNPLLSKYPDATQLLPVEVEVKGIQFNNRRVVAQQVNAGDNVNLVRDYDNPVDSNAIKVMHSRGELGFVPRETAQLLALEIDTGLKVVSSITKVSPGKVPHVAISIFELEE